MLRYGLRRILWVIPSVLSVSVITFFILSLLPLPASPRGVAGGASAAERARLSFEGLPLFFNESPRDVRSVAAAAMADVADSPPGSERAMRGADELERLGGAALPHVLPRLDSLAPDVRVRVALALAPVAERMGVPGRAAASEPQRVLRFWQRFWDTRATEFRPAAVRTAVRRYARYGTEARAKELIALDTFALPALMEALEVPGDEVSVDAMRPLVEILAHITGRDDRLVRGATIAASAATVQRWEAWWMAYRADYVELVGGARVVSFVVETRYGHWLLQAVMHRLGQTDEGQPVLEALVERGAVTLAVLFGALALAYLFAIPVGALTARFRGRWGDRLVTVLVLLPYALSPAALATLAWRFGNPSGAPIAWAIGVLALVLVADPTRHQRSGLLPVLNEDFVRAARARGAGGLRVLFVHALRNALLPLISRASVELPVALTACFVVEHAFGLRGLGQATVRAVASHDTTWLMALAVSASATVVCGLVLSDLVYAALDPRVRTRLMRAGRRRA